MMNGNKMRLTSQLQAVVLVLLAGLSQTSSWAQLTPSTDKTLQQHRPRYVLQSGDVVALTFPISPELNQTVTIQPDGYIDLQSAGDIYVQGLTAPQLVTEIRRAYIGILKDPIINVDITDFQKPFFTVSGQVGKPGQYELRQELTVAEGLAVAGGMSPTAKQQVFLLRRTAEGTQYHVMEVNIGKLLTGKSKEEIATLEPGDMIYVPEKYIVNFRKYLPYSANAGTYVNPGF